MQLEDFSWEFAGGMFLIFLIYLAITIPLFLVIVYGNFKDEAEEDEGEVKE